MTEPKKSETKWVWASAMYEPGALRAARVLAARMGISRSELLRMALLEYLHNHWRDSKEFYELLEEILGE